MGIPLISTGRCERQRVESTRARGERALQPVKPLSVPAPAAVPAAAEQKQQDDDDEKYVGVHGITSWLNRYLANPWTLSLVPFARCHGAANGGEKKWSIRYRRRAMPTIRHDIMVHPPITAKIIAAFLSLAGTGSVANAVENWKGQTGIASIYSGKGGKTTSGEKPDLEGMTAAHPSLPFGTIVRVTNSQNNRSVVVRINDRGPFTRGRVIDLTPAAARALGFSGLARVRLSVVAATP